VSAVSVWWRSSRRTSLGMTASNRPVDACECKAQHQQRSAAANAKTMTQKQSMPCKCRPCHHRRPCTTHLAVWNNAHNLVHLPAQSIHRVAVSTRPALIAPASCTAAYSLRRGQCLLAIAGVDIPVFERKCTVNNFHVIAGAEHNVNFGENKQHDNKAVRQCPPTATLAPIRT
jgi:hypothetical protein